VAEALVKFLSGPHALPIIQAKGMEPADAWMKVIQRVPVKVQVPEADKQN
jgi:multidrug resistance efflux pump